MTDSQLLLRDFTLPRLFHPQSVWREMIDDLPVSSNSECTARITLEVLESTNVSTVMQVGHESYTFPIFATSLTNRLNEVQIRSYDGDEWSPVTNPWYRDKAGKVWARGIPIANTPVRPSDPSDSDSDGAVILFNVDTGEEYDFWQAATINADSNLQGAGKIGEPIVRAGAVAYFRTDSLGTQLPICDARATTTLPRSSSRASGLPYLAGLLTPEDLENGPESAISHPLVFILPRLRHIPDATEKDPPDFVYPATNTETFCYIENPNALAAGQRIRLKPRVQDDTGKLLNENEQHVAPIARIFFKALREYGAYLVDGGAGFGFAAEDFHTANLKLNERTLKSLVGLDESSELPPNKTQWQIVMEELNEQLSWKAGGGAGHGISFAQNPDGRSFYSNFDVVENAATPDINWLRHIEDDSCVRNAALY